MSAADPWTPVDAEMRLRAIEAALDPATDAVRRARDAEITAWRKYRDARTEAMLSPDCPQVKRGGHTTGYRDAWVEQRAIAEEEAYKRATAAREDAVDSMFKLKDQAAIAGKLSDLVRQSYFMAGSH